MRKPGYAIIDRITDGVATLLVGADRIVVDRDTLPEGVKEGDGLRADTTENLVAAPERTGERKKGVRGKPDRLRNQ